MKISVPFYSQYQDVLSPEWKPRACAVTCLKMVLDFHRTRFDATIPNLSGLITEGVSMTGFSAEEGWSHDILVLLAHNRGIPAYREEFRSRFCESQMEALGLEKISKVLQSGNPVIVSVSRQFRDKDKFHQVVLSGIENSNGEVVGFYYHDPEFTGSEEGSHLFVSSSEFSEHWRKFAIFIG